MERDHHWNRIYATKADEEVSWFEALPSVSLTLMQAAGLDKNSCVIDVGGGDSRLVDHLVEQGLDCIAVLDVSGAALAKAKARVGSEELQWIEADVTGEWISQKPMDIWHDRAVFHFLTSADDRARYKARLLQTVKPGGGVIVAPSHLTGQRNAVGCPSFGTRLTFSLGNSVPS